ncbi:MULTISPECIES: arsenite efflux transporter metallochaperone ArsD [unclassified Desulfosporosinus]|uniref:arsenite efflux transporter metallochaperone ArsD n=1 Tax=unclassified Desulfosporosinus TaxID=2633794 RepID=UPI000B49D7B6|nr:MULTISPECIES: arsenite efflux transporter metallochaperone ArsD [unclassified Desulfosporosinus]
MKKMQIFEPAMCCSTGLCGVGVDTELLRISTVLNSLKKNGVEVDRFNLTNAPMEFVNNKAVNDLLQTKGVEQLPATVLDGEILITGRYPSNEEFAKLLNIPISLLSEKEKDETFTILPKTSGCGCSDGNC